MSTINETECSKSGKCQAHAFVVAESAQNDKRIAALEVIVKDIPRMQARVHLLMYILIGTMTILISISCFSFLQLVDFKKTYFADRQKHQQVHSDETLQQEQRYVDLINKLGNRVGQLEARHIYEDRNKKVK